MARLNLWQPIDFIGCHLLGPSFVGGFSISEVLHTGAELKKRGYTCTYNLLGEHIKHQGTISKTVETILELMARMDKTNPGNVAIKPTQCGLEVSPQLFYENAEKIVRRAREVGVEIEFDAEADKYIEDSFRVFHDLASRFHYRGFMRQCVQAHLTDIFDLMDEYELWDKKLRIVEGSQVYPELPGVVLEDKSQVFEQYCFIIRRNHAEGQVPFVATVCDRKKVEAAKKILPSPHMLEFEMLYNSLPCGLFGRKLAQELTQGDDIFFEEKFLAHIEWPVRIYIPFVVDWCHDAWIDYGLRRASMMRRLFCRDLKPKVDKILDLYGELGWKWH